MNVLPVQDETTNHAAAFRDVLSMVDVLRPRGELTTDAVMNDLRRLVARVTIERQIEALHATAILLDNKMAHLAIAFVRQSLDELIWMNYLAKLEADDARKLLPSLVAWDALRSVGAERGYCGDETMIRHGFPPDFIAKLDVRMQEVRDRIGDSGRSLGWPNPKRIPDARWLADQCGIADLYEYLYSASSRSVHFSAGELARRGWFYSDQLLDTVNSNHRQFLGDFAVYHLVDLLVRTFMSAVEFFVVQEFEEEPMNALVEKLKLLKRYGRVPLTVPQEFNLA